MRLHGCVLGIVLCLLPMSPASANRASFCAEAGRQLAANCRPGSKDASLCAMSKANYSGCDEGSTPSSPEAQPTPDQTPNEKADKFCDDAIKRCEVSVNECLAQKSIAERADYNCPEVGATGTYGTRHSNAGLLPNACAAQVNSSSKPAPAEYEAASPAPGASSSAPQQHYPTGGSGNAEIPADGGN